MPLSEHYRTQDPAAWPRLLITVLAVLLIWPGLVLTEFNPTTLIEPGNAQVFGRFLIAFWPPELSSEFLQLLLKATLEITSGPAAALSGTLAAHHAAQHSRSGLGFAAGARCRSWPNRWRAGHCHHLQWHAG